MKLQNISNTGRIINLFVRNGDKLIISSDNSYYPYFFEEDKEGKYVGYGGTRLRKIVLNHPKDVRKTASIYAWNSDINYCKKYCSDKVDIITKSDPRYFLIDIECKCDELPSSLNPKFPVSCISLYDNFTDNIETWFLNDYEQGLKGESKLLNDFIDYIKTNIPDIISAWHSNFDYDYLSARLYSKFKIDFAKTISPINQKRFVRRDENGNPVYYPSGISIIDYKGLYEKFTLNKKARYSLDYIAVTDLGEKNWEKTDFNVVSETVRKKNISDVRRMVKLENKFLILDYFNEIRCLTGCMWEDLPQETMKKDGRLIKISNNSKVLEPLFLKEAKKQNLVLPNKPIKENIIDERFQGAFRETYETGLKHNLNSYDLSSAYPSMIIDFCLDSTNIVNIENSNNICKIDAEDKFEGNSTYYYNQDQTKLLPVVTKKLLKLKDKLKLDLEQANPNDNKYKILETSYKAQKSLANSIFGIFGNKHFRLYDNRIVKTITFLVRDLLTFVKTELEKKGYKIVFIDTDSVVIDSRDDIEIMLNNMIQGWGKKYGKNKINIKFNFEGYFSKILLFGKCHYYSYLVNKKGVECREIKGVEVLRSSSSKYESEFQQNMIEKVLDNVKETGLVKWVKDEKERIKSFPLDEIGFPFKLKDQEYKNIPIFKRSYENAKILDSDFNLAKGEIGYYIFIKPKVWGYANKPANVTVVTETMTKSEINWDEVVRRNIMNKATKIFEIMNWDIDKLNPEFQLKLW